MIVINASHQNRHATQTQSAISGIRYKRGCMSLTQFGLSSQCGSLSFFFTSKTLTRQIFFIGTVNLVIKNIVKIIYYWLTEYKIILSSLLNYLSKLITALWTLMKLSISQNEHFAKYAKGLKILFVPSTI